MRRATENLLAAATCLALVGCASTPVGFTQSRRVPAERVAYLPRASNPQTAAHVTIVRDVGFVGGGATLRLRLNGKLVASFHTGESLAFTLDPGEYVLGVKPSPYLGSGLSETSLTARAGEHYFFRLSSQGGEFKLQRSAEINH